MILQRLGIHNAVMFCFAHLSDFYQILCQYYKMWVFSYQYLDLCLSWKVEISSTLMLIAKWQWSTIAKGLLPALNKTRHLQFSICLTPPYLHLPNTSNGCLSQLSWPREAFEVLTSRYYATSFLRSSQSFYRYFSWDQSWTVLQTHSV